MEIRRLQKVLKPFHRRINNLMTRGVLKLVNADGDMQTLQMNLLAGETLDEIEHFEPYGFTSHPQADAEVLLTSLGGQRDHSIVVCISDRRFRLKALQQGEVALFTDEGDFIHFKRDNEIHLKAQTKLTIETPEANFYGNITAAGNISDANGSMQEMRDTYNSHEHPNGNNGSPTGAPTTSMS